MGNKDREVLKRVDRAIKIEQLKDEAAVRGEFHNDDYWEFVYDLKFAPLTTDYEILAEAGIEFAPSETLDDDEVTAKLWEIIEALAEMRVYITSTDHLSERELYKRLVDGVLREPRRDVVFEEGESYIYDLVSGGGEDDSFLFFRYYANDRDRLLWGDEAEGMPARIEPPYDRDRFLPGASEWHYCARNP